MEGGPPPGDENYDEQSSASDNRIYPLENVYSYFMFMIPVEEYKASMAREDTKKNSCSTFLAIFIVFVSFFLQTILLTAIFKETVTAHISWKEGIVSSDPSECFEASSLCTREPNSGGMFTCAPPTIQLSGRWEDLDTNADGVWSIEEVTAARDDLKCKFGVDPVEVFNVYVKFLIGRENVIFIEPDLRAGKAIRHVYFMYAAGDIIMCNYRNADMCPNLLERGFFDAPLKTGSVPRVGTTIDSALEYCYSMLDDGGLCERTLPSTYSVWRKSSVDQCGGADFNPFVYKHPKTGDVKSMLAVDYNSRQAFEHADRSKLFLVYKSCIISIYLLSMFVELRDIMSVIIWVVRYDSASAFREPITMEDDVYTIHGVTMRHRACMAVFTGLRLIMLGILTWVGIAFLLKETGYVDLLLNGLGLIFVVEISQLCYSQLLDSSLRDTCANITPMELPTGGVSCFKGRAAIRDLMWIAAVLATLIVIVTCNFMFEVKPVDNALTCTCLAEGDKCVEAAKFDSDFWDDYWLNVVPTSIADISALQPVLGGPPVPLPTEGTPPAAFHAARHKHHEHSQHVIRSGAPPARNYSAGWPRHRNMEAEAPPVSNFASWRPLAGAIGSLLGPAWGVWGVAMSTFGRIVSPEGNQRYQAGPASDEPMYFHLKHRPQRERRLRTMDSSAGS